MNSLFNQHEDEIEERGGPRDREITLGTTVILGIFFALAVLCAAFFGFGYSMGSRRTVPLAAASRDSVPTSTFNNFKPAPGSPLGSPKVKQVLPESTPPSASPDEEDRTPSPPPPARISPSQKAETVLPQPNSPLSEKGAVRAQATPVPPPAAQTIVQIAAVSHQEDADLLISTLKRRGYSVSVRQESQDKLLHVQIGPFASRKDADAMRQRLLADGFNAIVK